MKKLFILSLLVMFGLSFCAYAETTATKARAATFGNGIEQVVAVGDVASGWSADVDSNGRLIVGGMRSSSYEFTNPAAAAGLLLTNCTVNGTAYITGLDISGPNTAAGDYYLVYDAVTATGVPKFEISVGTAKDTNSISIPEGATMSTGIYIDTNDPDVFGSIRYQN